MEIKTASHRRRTPPVKNQNGQIIISCMKRLNEPATAFQILKEVAQKTNSAPAELRPFLIAVLNAGVRFGFIGRRNRRYELDMPQVANLFEGITVAPRWQHPKELQVECALPLRSSDRLLRKARIRDRMNDILKQLSQRDISATSKVLITLMHTKRDTPTQYKSTARQRNFRTISLPTKPIEDDDVIVISDSSSTSLVEDKINNVLANKKELKFKF